MLNISNFFWDDSQWSYLKKSNDLHKFAFFPTDSDNEQSVLTFIIDLSINTKLIGAKSIISVQSIHGTVEMKLFKHLFSKLYIPQSKREINNFVYFLQSNWKSFLKDEQNLKIENVIETLDNCSDIDNCCDKVQFIRKQLALLNLPDTARRYDNFVLLKAFSIYIKGTKAYEECRKILNLPSIRHMRRLSAFLRPDPTLNDNNFDYLKEQFNLLKDYEKFVFLKIDEVYLSPGLDFQGEQVFGYAENSKTPQLANTCQTFLIASAFSKYQEVVRLSPVRNQTHPQLKTSLMEVLDVLSNVGLEITGLICEMKEKFFFIHPIHI